MNVCFMQAPLVLEEQFTAETTQSVCVVAIGFSQKIYAEKAQACTVFRNEQGRGLTCSYQSSTLAEEAIVFVGRARNKGERSTSRTGHRGVSNQFVREKHCAISKSPQPLRTGARSRPSLLPYAHLLELKNASVAGMTIVATARVAADCEGPHPNVSPMSLVPIPHANRAGAPSTKLIKDFLPPPGCGKGGTDIKPR